MSDITPKPDPPDDPALTAAIARAAEIIDRLEKRRNEVLEQRRADVTEVQTLARSESLLKAAGRPLRGRLTDIARAADENLARIDTDRQNFVEAMKKARTSLGTGKKRRRAVGKG